LDEDFNVDMANLLIQLSTQGKRIGAGNFGCVSTVMVMKSPGRG
jgi:hypothetical protein